jgi:hypothetical protein
MRVRVLLLVAAAVTLEFFLGDRNRSYGHRKHLWGEDDCDGHCNDECFGPAV